MDRTIRFWRAPISLKSRRGEFAVQPSSASSRSTPRRSTPVFSRRPIQLARAPARWTRKTAAAPCCMRFTSASTASSECSSSLPGFPRLVAALRHRCGLPLSSNRKPYLGKCPVSMTSALGWIKSAMAASECARNKPNTVRSAGSSQTRSRGPK